MQIPPRLRGLCGRHYDAEAKARRAFANAILMNRIAADTPRHRRAGKYRARYYREGIALPLGSSARLRHLFRQGTAPARFGPAVAGQDRLKSPSSGPPASTRRATDQPRNHGLGAHPVLPSGARTVSVRASAFDGGGILIGDVPQSYIQVPEVGMASTSSPETDFCLECVADVASKRKRRSRQDCEREAISEHVPRTGSMLDKATPGRRERLLQRGRAARPDPGRTRCARSWICAGAAQPAHPQRRCRGQPVYPGHSGRCADTLCKIIECVGEPQASAPLRHAGRTRARPSGRPGAGGHAARKRGFSTCSAGRAVSAASSACAACFPMCSPDAGGVGEDARAQFGELLEMNRPGDRARRRARRHLLRRARRL